MAKESACYKPRRGMALVLVLWLLTVLSTVALEVSLFSHLRLQATRNVGDAARSLFLAAAGVERAIAELKEGRDSSQTLEDLREGPDRFYQNVEIGEGSYTLLAERSNGEGAEPEYGISDEAAKLNLNTANETMLSRIPGVDLDLAADIMMLRKENETIRDVGDLLLIERVDRLVLYGEDQNQNGLPDPNEDDGDESWPPDDRDGVLDLGLAAYLTCCSAARNVTSDGKERTDINAASAQAIAAGVPGITQQQAESIVEHRKKQKFESAADLLDVALVEKAAEKKSDEETQNNREGDQPGGTAKSESGGGGGGSPESSAQPSEEDKKSETTTTGKKAFDVNTFKDIADHVTTSDEKVLQGVINLNTAQPTVLACLPGIDEALAAEIYVHRQETKFESVADLLDVRGMSDSKLKQVWNLVSVRSDVLSVRSFGVLGRKGEARGGVHCCVAAVVDRTEDEIRLRSWRELR